ncbi:MAG: ABC transporter permease [Patescibacteria group bacterium]
MIILLKKELSYYLNNAVGYIVIILFAVFANFLFMRDAFVTGSVSMRSFFNLIPWLFLIFIPAVVMRSLSEEKRLNTVEILLTLPISETQIILSKFITHLILLFFSLFLTMLIPASFTILSGFYIPEIVIGYAGCLIMGASFISISLFFSSQTKNQIISFLLSSLGLFLLIGISSELFSSFLPKSMQDILIFLGPINHFQNFIKGIIDLRSVFYFTSISIVFIFLTIVQLEKRD